jgi:hypothetical protein
MTVTSRRAVLAGAAALPALSFPALASEPDPIFEAIERLQKLNAEQFDLWSKLDDAEGKIDERRPIALVRWRNYHIGGSEIDQRREILLRDALSVLPPGHRDTSANRERAIAKIEREYLEMKTKEKKLEEGETDWDKRYGLDKLRERHSACLTEIDEAEEALAAIVPTTTSGCAALLEYALVDLEAGDLSVEGPDWRFVCVRNAANAIRKLGAVA